MKCCLRSEDDRRFGAMKRREVADLALVIVTRLSAHSLLSDEVAQIATGAMADKNALYVLEERADAPNVYALHKAGPSHRYEALEKSHAVSQYMEAFRDTKSGSRIWKIGDAISKSLAGVEGSEREIVMADLTLEELREELRPEGPLTEISPRARTKAARVIMALCSELDDAAAKRRGGEDGMHKFSKPVVEPSSADDIAVRCAWYNDWPLHISGKALTSAQKRLAIGELLSALSIPSEIKKLINNDPINATHIAMTALALKGYTDTYVPAAVWKKYESVFVRELDASPIAQLAQQPPASPPPSAWPLRLVNRAIAKDEKEPPDLAFNNAAVYVTKHHNCLRRQPEERLYARPRSPAEAPDLFGLISCIHCTEGFSDQTQETKRKTPSRKTHNTVRRPSLPAPADEWVDDPFLAFCAARGGA